MDHITSICGRKQDFKFLIASLYSLNYMRHSLLQMDLARLKTQLGLSLRFDMRSQYHILTRKAYKKLVKCGVELSPELGDLACVFRLVQDPLYPALLRLVPH
jgi:hypothetical protein